jgi:hypothetical protein
LQSLDFSTQVYLIVSQAHGKLDLLLRDTMTSIEEIAYDTRNINRYRYEQECTT